MLTNFQYSDGLANYYSLNYSQKMNEKLTYKIKIKSSNYKYKKKSKKYSSDINLYK